jgi:hypothetical protein
VGSERKWGKARVLAKDRVTYETASHKIASIKQPVKTKDKKTAKNTFSIAAEIAGNQFPYGPNQ